MKLLHRRASDSGPTAPASSLWRQLWLKPSSWGLLASFLIVGGGTVVLAAQPKPASNKPSASEAHAINIDAESSHTISSANSGGSAVNSQLKFETNAAPRQRSTTHLTVNGQPVTVPVNGTVNKTYTDSDGQTSLTVTTNNQSSATGANNNQSSSTSLNIDISSQSSTYHDSGDSP
jgi:hypothetical protein